MYDNSRKLVCQAIRWRVGIVVRGRCACCFHDLLKGLLVGSSIWVDVKLEGEADTSFDLGRGGFVVLEALLSLAC
jgi:hypothetical protein